MLPGTTSNKRDFNAVFGSLNEVWGEYSSRLSIMIGYFNIVLVIIMFIITLALGPYVSMLWPYKYGLNLNTC